MGWAVNPADGVAMGEVARAASSAAAPGDRAQEVLLALAGLIPYECAQFAAWDPLRGEHYTLGNVDYPPAVLDHLCSDQYARELVEFGTWGSVRAYRVRDLPREPEAVPTFSTVLAPRGFAEGLTACLHTQSGRYVGTLNLSTSSLSHPTDSARAAVEILAGALANAIDAARFQRQLVDWVDPGATALMIGRDGETAQLPGTSGDETLADQIMRDPRSPVGAARRLLQLERVPTRFMWRATDSESWRAVQVLSCEDSGLVVVGPICDAHRLTSREMQVLSLIAEGWSNRQIADHLIVAQRTVATHVERILAKLGEQTRAGAAARATREGLLIPFATEPGAIAV